MNDSEPSTLPACDECGSDQGSLWCDKCSVVLCDDCAMRSGRHQTHPVGAIGPSDDPYNYGGEEGATGVLESSDPGVITEYITESQAYHVVEMMECNSHQSCRKLFLPTARTSLQNMLRAGIVPDPFTKAAYADDQPLTLTPEQWSSLVAHSYVVIDDFVSVKVALEAREQTLGLVKEGYLTDFRSPNDVGRDHSARSDLRVFIDGSDRRNLAHHGPLQSIVQRLDALGKELALGISLTGEQHEYQLAYYGSQGEHYERHRDAFPNDGSKRMTGQVGRRVTCTLYMNPYEEEQGGKLRIYVPTPGFDGEDSVDISPIAGRAVLFLSGAMEHEVLPSFAPRCAIAAWYS